MLPIAAQCCNNMPQIIPLASSSACAVPASGDFTVLASIDTANEPGWTIGDVFSQYDPASRRGMALSVITNNGGPSSQSNRRQLSFFIDDGADPRWTDCGQPDGCRMVFTFVIHRGRLLAGINAPDGRGRLVEYEAPGKWIDRGEAPDGSNAIQSAVVHGDDLFVVTGCYDGTGSALPKASNTRPGGTVYRVDDQFNFHDCGNPYTLPWRNQCPALFSFSSRLYLASSFHPDLYVHEGGQTWTRIATPPLAMCVMAAHRGKLFAAPKLLKASMFPNTTTPKEHGPVFVMSADGSWTPCGSMPGAGRVYTMVVHDGQLHAGSWPQGLTHRSATGEGDWVNVGPCGCGPLPPHTEPRGEIMAMASYHGQLYVGTLPYAEVYRCDGDHRWTQVRRLDTASAVPICRTWTCAEYDGGLFFSTLPRGEVFRMDAGVGVTDPSPLATGARRVAAVRHGDELALYVDGRRVASHRDPLVRTMSIGSGTAGRVGVGPYSAFRGQIHDVQVVPRALNDRELTP